MIKIIYAINKINPKRKKGEIRKIAVKRLPSAFNPESIGFFVSITAGLLTYFEIVPAFPPCGSGED
jgi:hypothetical protein